MKIKIVASKPIDEQTGIERLIGEEFETIPYSQYCEDTRKEMKMSKQVGIMVEGSPFTLNKDEYVKI